jgi:2-oxoacid:acceptor oxidoreductase delta subunit (pyruvate/2-ketoisovalerate family)
MIREFATILDPGTSLANKTGSWRTERPLYVDRLPPCNHACPAGENCQAWLYHAEAGDYRAAWEEIMTNNPLPAIMGRACYHPCETECNRAKLDEAVTIHAVERFLGDLAIAQGWNVSVDVPETGLRVLVVGSGPSGLSAAYHLRRLGHTVTIMEAGPVPGGMMRFGIPKYRLPREVLDAEVKRLAELGIEIRVNAKVEDIVETMARDGYDACFAAIGAHLAKRVDIPAPDAGKILDAIGVLRQMETEIDGPQLGRRVVVYGGGNTALDAARTAKRLGNEAVIVYRRNREKAPALDFEIQEALEEGVQIHWLSTITSMDEGELTIEKMKLNDEGWPEPTGEFETIAGDTIVLALGQDVDTSVLGRIPDVAIRKDGIVEVDRNMMTGHPGIFAGGDMVPAERTITVAIGHGKKAARCIDAYLRGSETKSAPKHELADFKLLNSWYYNDADQTRQPVLDEIRRRTTFEEVVSGLDETTALFEARRCLSCGNCFECDNCFAICPDNAIVKLGPGKRFEVNYDFCKGCGMCATECPCGAIQMVPEAI